jgi:hypothetical protein
VKDALGVVVNNPLTYEFQRNLQGTTIALQLLTFGGWPLLAGFLSVCGAAIASLWRRGGFVDDRVLLIAAILCSVLIQSQLTSPFLYLCLAVALAREPGSVRPVSR